MKFYKYHALGNDYLVLNPQDCPNLLADMLERLALEAKNARMHGWRRTALRNRVLVPIVVRRLDLAVFL